MILTKVAMIFTLFLATSIPAFTPIDAAQLADGGRDIRAGRKSYLCTP